MTINKTIDLYIEDDTKIYPDFHFAFANKINCHIVGKVRIRVMHLVEPSHKLHSITFFLKENASCTFYTMSSAKYEFYLQTNSQLFFTFLNYTVYRGSCCRFKAFLYKSSKLEVTCTLLGEFRNYLHTDLLVRHLESDTSSKIITRHLLDEQSISRCNLRSIIDKNVNNASIIQQSTGFIFANTSNLQVTPQLEINSPNVQASHEVKIEQFIKNNLFYLNSRGIDKLSCRYLIKQYLLK